MYVRRDGRTPEEMELLKGRLVLNATPGVRIMTPSKSQEEGFGRKITVVLEFRYTAAVRVDGKIILCLDVSDWY